jgi:arylsulfatase A-like enzyme
VIHEPGAAMDVFPTILGIAGGDPQGYDVENERPVEPCS